MSADLHALLDTDPAAGLRGVAALMREREASEWRAKRLDFIRQQEPTGCRECERATRAYEPPRDVFVLAVADWLEAEVGKQTPTSHLAVTFDGTPMFPVDAQAVATARAYLGKP